MYDKLLNVSEAAKFLGVSPSTLRRLEKDGVVEGYGLKVIYTPGGQRRYIYDEIQQLYTNPGFSGKLGMGEKPALLVRDLTFGFFEPHSPLSIQVEKQVETIKQLIELCKEKNIPVILNKTVYKTNVSVKTLWSKKFPAIEMLKEDSHWIQTIPELNDYKYDQINMTPYITDFYGSPLDDFLKSNDIDTLILSGVTTSGSIRATAVDGLQRGYRILIPKEGVGDRNNSLQTTTLIDLNARYADVMNTNEITSSINNLKSLK